MKLGKDKNNDVSGDILNKILVALVIVAALVMISISGVYYAKYILKKSDVEFKKQKIDEMAIAEKVAEEYDKTVAAYNTVKAFVDTTHNDNIVLLTFLNDLETIIPEGTTIDSLEALDGEVVFTVTAQSKEAVADTYVKIKNLEYVQSVELPEIVESRKQVEIDDNGRLIVDADFEAKKSSDPYNYSDVEDTYEITVALKDKNYVVGGVDVDSAINSDDSSDETEETTDDIDE